MASQAGDRVEWALVLAFSDQGGESARGHQPLLESRNEEGSGSETFFSSLSNAASGGGDGSVGEGGGGGVESPDTDAWS